MSKEGFQSILFIKPNNLIKETNELIAIFVTSIRNAKKVGKSILQ